MKFPDEPIRNPRPIEPPCRACLRWVTECDDKGDPVRLIWVGGDPHTCGREQPEAVTA